MKTIEITNAAELAKLLYQEGSEYFYQGAFQKAIEVLLRCVRAPKDRAEKIYDARSYHLLGVLYGHLEQETLSKENLLKSLKVCREYGLKRQEILCYLSLAFLHEKLKDYEAALRYEDLAQKLLEDFSEEVYLKKISLAYHGIIYDKLGERGKSKDAFAQIKQLVEKEGGSFGVPALALALRVSYQQQELDAFYEYFKQLLTAPVKKADFIELEEFYFDICAFLEEQNRSAELKQLLAYMEEYAQKLPLAYMKQHIYTCQVSCMKKYGTEQQYWESVKKLIAILPEYDEEQQQAKLYSFDYIEFLHETRNISAKMEQKSKQDPMTGLLNKYTIEFLADEYFKQMEPGSAAALILVDMDHFKQINDTLGHLAGDAILADTARIISRFFKEDTLCGRIGGDEFLVFVKDVKDMAALLLQAELLRQEIAKTTSERNITIAIQASIGVAVSTAGYFDYASMFAAADEALYRAKKEGRNRIAVIE